MYNLDVQALYDADDVDKGTEEFAQFLSSDEAADAFAQIGEDDIELQLRARNGVVSSQGDGSTATSTIVLVSVLVALAALIAVAVLAFFVSTRYWRKHHGDNILLSGGGSSDDMDGGSNGGGGGGAAGAWGRRDRDRGRGRGVAAAGGGVMTGAAATGMGMDMGMDNNYDGLDGGHNLGGVVDDLDDDDDEEEDVVDVVNNLNGDEDDDDVQSLEYLDEDSTYTAATSRAADYHSAGEVGYVPDNFGRGRTALEEDEAIS